VLEASTTRNLVQEMFQIAGCGRRSRFWLYRE